MDAAAYDLRLARPGDVDVLRKSVRRTLNNPEGKTQRKSFADAIGRGELLLLTRSERGQEARSRPLAGRARRRSAAAARAGRKAPSGRSAGSRESRGSP